MSKDFNEWNIIKENIHQNKKSVIFKERDIMWASIGVNIGYEQDGKGKIFSRPVLIVKKFNNNLFFGVPLSTQIKKGSFFYEFTLNNKPSNALLVQGRLYDSKRLENKIGMISKDDFYNLKKELKGLLNV
jgi:mRNA interferase MazF